MRFASTLMAAVTLIACSPGSDIRVAGHSLTVNDSFFVPLTTDGEMAILVLSDDPNSCTKFQQSVASGNTTSPLQQATTLSFFLQRQGGVGAGQYPVVQTYDPSGANAGVSTASFSHNEDGSATVTSGKTGTLTVRSFVRDSSVAGDFTVTFGKDTVESSFEASVCEVIKRQEQQAQSGICKDYLACLERTSPGSTSSLGSSYGEGGTCWQSLGASESCTSACEQGIATLRATAAEGC